MLLVDFDCTTRERRNLRASRNNNVLGLDLTRGVGIGYGFDGETGVRQKGCRAFNVINLVLLEEELDTFCKAVDRVLLSFKHFREVERNTGDLKFLTRILGYKSRKEHTINTPTLKIMLSLVEEMRIVQHGF